MQTSWPLRAALASNAAFSTACGLYLIAPPARVVEWLGTGPSVLIPVIGLGLVLFAADLTHQATRPRVLTWRALLASGADFLWVLGSCVLLIAAPGLFSPSGVTLVLLTAGIVGTFGAWQLWAAGWAHRLRDSDVYRHCILVQTDVAAERMWLVIGDVGAISRYMPSLRESTMVDGRAPAVGAVRVCEDRAGRRWAEEIVEFTVGKSFTMRFHAETPGFPFPAVMMRGGWEVMPAGSGSMVKVWWEMVPTRRLLAPIILPLLAFRADRDFAEVIRRMAAAAKVQTGDDQPLLPADNMSTQLLPNPC
jgi:hypothetical protein